MDELQHGAEFNIPENLQNFQQVGNEAETELAFNVIGGSSSKYANTLSAAREQCPGKIVIDGEYHLDELLHLMLETYSLDALRRGLGAVQKIEDKEATYAYVEPSRRVLTVDKIPTIPVGADYNKIRGPLQVFGAILKCDRNGFVLDDNVLDFRFGMLASCGSMTVAKGGPTLEPDWSVVAARKILEDWGKKNVKAMTGLPSVGWISPIGNIDAYMKQVRDWNQKGKKPAEIAKTCANVYEKNENAFDASLLKAGLVVTDGNNAVLPPMPKATTAFNDLLHLGKKCNTLILECRNVRGEDNAEEVVAPWTWFPHVPRKLSVWRQVMWFVKQFGKESVNYLVDDQLLKAMASVSDVSAKNVLCIDPVHKQSSMHDSVIAKGMPELFDYYANTGTVLTDKMIATSMDLKPAGIRVVSVALPKNDEGMLFLAKHLAAGWCVFPGSRPHNYRFWLTYGVPNGGGFEVMFKLLHYGNLVNVARTYINMLPNVEGVTRASFRYGGVKTGLTHFAFEIEESLGGIVAGDTIKMEQEIANFIADNPSKKTRLDGSGSVSNNDVDMGNNK